MRNPFRIVVVGLTITSSWGNGHATTYRALLRALGALGHDILFLERDVPWYAHHRDLVEPQGCRVALYQSLEELTSRHAEAVRQADAVIVGSYVPDGALVLDWVLETAGGLRLFYDIDTPVTLAKLESGDETYLAARSIPGLDAYLSFTSGPTLGFVEQKYGAQLALPLFCSVDERSYAPTQALPRRDLGYLGTYSADRQPVLERLLVEPARLFPAGRFIVAGPCYPAECAWPENVERLEHVAPGAHRAFYGSLRFTLNVTRADMVKMGYSPSVRLFEAAACGTPIISDRWAGIERFFEPGREILLAEEPGEVLDYIKHVSEAERVALSRRARARVLKQHTAAHRAAELDRYLRELRANRTGLLRAISNREQRDRVDGVTERAVLARAANHSADT